LFFLSTEYYLEGEAVVNTIVVMIRARLNGNYPFLPAAWNSNGRLKPNVALVNGKEQKVELISTKGFTVSPAPVASRRGKHRWHLAPELPPSIFRCFRDTHVASPSTHQLGHRRLRQLHAQHIGASRPTALRRHRHESGWKACQSADREGAKPVDV